MEVVRGVEKEVAAHPCAVTVGTFDGLHIGHQKIINRLKTVAAERHLCTTLVTFDPHPKVVVKPNIGKELGLLTTLDEKMMLLEESGLDRLVIITFDDRFSQTAYEEFVKNILIDKLGARAIIVGYDHGFGKNREGNFEKLQELSRKYGFYVEQIGPIDVEDEIIGSTLIRKFLKNGNVKQAQTYLGRPYSMVGKVIKGNNIGKRYNYPTANLEVIDPHKLVPANGVYAVDVIFENKTYKSMLNIGVKPTFGGDNHSIEVHIFNFDKNLYDKYLTVKFKERLRDEQKFDTVEDLFKQLEIDKKKSLLI